MQRYGGVLAPECANYLLPQLLYLGDSLVVRSDGKPVLTGRNVKADPTYFGASPPSEFELALTGDVAVGEKLVFVFYRNASVSLPPSRARPKSWPWCRARSREDTGTATRTATLRREQSRLKRFTPAFC
jgi:hypothetical protein